MTLTLRCPECTSELIFSGSNVRIEHQADGSHSITFTMLVRKAPISETRETP